MSYDYVKFQKAKRRERNKFRPTEEQLVIAERRIIAVFEKFGGAIMEQNEACLVRFLCAKVHNRDRQLGDYRKGEFTITIQLALKSAISRGLISETNGWFGLTAPARNCGRKHRQKYPTGKRRLRVA